jgi:hypothetical protein
MFFSLQSLNLVKEDEMGRRYMVRQKKVPDLGAIQ